MALSVASANGTRGGGAMPISPAASRRVVETAERYLDGQITHEDLQRATSEAARATLLDILADAGRRLVPGTPASAIFDGVDRAIKDAFPGGEFPHHGGHGISVSAFEDPHLIPSDPTPLENWMLIAIEPGVYFDGVSGARVENIFLVTPDGGVELREAMGAS